VPLSQTQLSGRLKRVTTAISTAGAGAATCCGHRPRTSTAAPGHQARGTTSAPTSSCP